MITRVETEGIQTDASARRVTARALRDRVLGAFLFLGGAALVGAFETGNLLSPAVAVILFFALSAWALLKMARPRFMPLCGLMILLYVMPFTVCWGYIGDPDYSWWNTDLSRAFMANPRIVRGMLLVGLIGLLGLGSGILAGRSGRRRVRSGAFPRAGLGLVQFFGWIVAALFLSFISAPSTTIFSSVYEAEVGIAGKWNFNAAATLGYTFLVAAFVDAERDGARRERQWIKRSLVFAATGIILVFFQVLRGDRDAFGLVVALGGLYLTERIPEPGARAVHRRRGLLVGLAGVVVVLAFLAVATLRTGLAVGERPPLREAIRSGYNESTWGSALLTNLSLAAQYHEGRMVTEGGRTYWEYVLSLPPGILTNALGVRRPIERDQGPNYWFTDISAGGIHVVTVPFKNFHAGGALLVLLLYGYLIGRSEVIGQTGGWIGRLWYGSCFVASAQWFWYGDICFIREVMAFGIVAVLYRMSVGMSRKPTRAAPAYRELSALGNR
jgi:hypothetical protein